MLRRLTGLVVLGLWVVQGGCGGSAPPPPATSASAPPPGGAAPAPVSAPIEEAAPAPGDVYTTIPNSVSAVVIRMPKLLASPIGASEAATSVTDGLKNDFGLEAAQVDELILVFMGGSSGTAVSSPYGSGAAPYGPPSGSPYGPPPGSPYGRSETSSPAAPAAGSGESTGLASMVPSLETTVRIIRASTAMDQAKVRTALDLDATETQAGQQKFFRSKRPDGDAACFYDDRTVIVGRENALQSFFTSTTTATPTGSPYGPPAASDESAAAPPEKTLGDVLREAPAEFAVFGAKKNASAQPPSITALMPAAGGNANVATMLGAIAGAVPEGSIGLDLSAGAKLTIDLPMPNAESAQQLWSSLQGMQGMVGMAIEAQKVAATTAANGGPSNSGKAYEAGEQFVKSLKVERGGENNQHVLISGSLDQAMVESLAGTMKRDLLVPPGSEIARKSVEGQLKQIGVAAHTYLAEKGKLPTAAIMSADGKPLLSWRVALLPYLGQKELFDQFKLDEPWDNEHNRALAEKMPSVYAVPGVSEKGKTTIVAPVGEKTVFGHKEGATLVMASDGPSYTILAVQANADRAVDWTAPADLPFDAAKPTEGMDKTYPGVFLALWLDGQTHTIALNTATATTAGLFTYAGGEAVDLNALIAAAEIAATAPPSTATTPTETGAATAETKPAKTYPAGWEGDAQRAVDLGHDKEAARLALAAAITADDEALKQDVMRWNKMARPVHLLRWGVGVMPDPKRRAEPAAGGAGGVSNPYGRGFGAATSGEEGDEETADPKQEFDELAGEVGQDMIKEIRKRLDKGAFGKLFEYDRKEADDNSDSGVNFRLETARSPYGPSGPSAGQPSSGTPPTAEELDAVAERASRGLVILGKGDRRKLLAAAAEAEVDLLLIAEMTTKNSRSTDPAIQWVVVDVATKKNVGRESEPVPVANGGGNSYGGSFGAPSGGDPAAIASADAAARRKNTSEWLKAMDEALKFKDVPDLTKPELADKVVKQAAKMVGAGGQENPLPVLLELRYYQVLGALKPAEALPLVSKLLKDDAKAETFVNGSAEERKSLLESWLLPVPEGAAEAVSASDS